MKWIQRLLPVACLMVVFMSSGVLAQEITPEAITPQSLAEPDGTFIDVAGATLYYLDRGPVDGPVILLLHGFLGSTNDWVPVIDGLADAGYRVIAFDRPPFGLASKLTTLDYTAEGAAAFTRDLMDALDIPTATVVGHSAGGTVAAQVALLYPERVDHLVLVAAAIGIDGPTQGGFTRLIGAADPDDPQAQATLRALFSVIARGLQDVGDDRVEMFRLPGWEGGLLAFTRAQVNDPSPLAPEDLSALEVPTLVIWGEDDNIVPLSVGQNLDSILSDHRYIVYPDVGHMVMDDAPKQFNQDVLAFLSEVN